MNILLINHYAGSPRHGMEFRPYYLAREWVRQGHRVEIVACAVSHVRATAPDLQGRRERRETIDGIGYTWLPAPAYQGNGLGRARNMAAFLWQVWRRRGVLVRDVQPDVVIASSTYPMDTAVAAAIARRAGCAWVYEVHDLWPLSLIELSGMSPRHPFALMCGWFESWAYRHATRVVSMLPKVHGHMEQRGLALERLGIIPNGIALDDWAAPDQAALGAAVAAVLQQARAHGHSVVGYAGSMGLPNALDTLLDAAALLRDAPIAWVLVGDGHERERLQRRVQQEGLHRVHFLTPIPKAQIPAFLSGIDLAYIGWQRVPLYRFGIAPNKLMDYMMAGCVVLHAVEAGNDPVAESGCGLTVAPESPAAVAQGVQRLLALPLDERLAMGARGRHYVQTHHGYAGLARRFLELLPQAVAKRGRS